MTPLTEWVISALSCSIYYERETLSFSLFPPLSHSHTLSLSHTHILSLTHSCDADPLAGEHQGMEPEKKTFFFGSSGLDPKLQKTEPRFCFLSCLHRKRKTEARQKWILPMTNLLKQNIMVLRKPGKCCESKYIIPIRLHQL